MFFRFPPDAHWNAERNAVEFSVGFGEYEGVVRVGRRIFQALLDQAPTPERCLEAYHLHRTRLELIAERKVRRRQLTDAGNAMCRRRHHLPRPLGLAGSPGSGVAVVPLYAARLGDLKPGDFVVVQCAYGHDGLIHPAALRSLSLQRNDRQKWNVRNP